MIQTKNLKPLPSPVRDIRGKVCTILIILAGFLGTPHGFEGSSEAPYEDSDPHQEDRNVSKRGGKMGRVTIEERIIDLEEAVIRLRKSHGDSTASLTKKVNDCQEEILIITGQTPIYKRLIRLDVPLYASLAMGAVIYGSSIWEGRYDPTVFMSTVYTSYFFLTLLMRYATVMNRPS